MRGSNDRGETYSEIVKITVLVVRGNVPASLVAEKR